jgi:hypothetical protein
MKNPAIFLPALLLMFWTLTVLTLVPIRRVRAVMHKRVGIQDFKHGESERVPADVALPNRIFMNLLEVPVLFYFVSCIAYLTEQVTPALMTVAWLYVLLRFVHSGIYFTYNHVGHRAMVFGISNLLVVAMLAMVGHRLV